MYKIAKKFFQNLIIHTLWVFFYLELGTDQLIAREGGSLFAEQVIFCKSELKQLFFYKSEKCE